MEGATCSIFYVQGTVEYEKVNKIHNSHAGQSVMWDALSQRQNMLFEHIGERD